MNWIKRNQNTTLLLVFAFIAMIILLITYRDTTTYTNIKVHEGDTLWSLANQHKGDLSNEEWVRLVKSENNIIDDKIIAGHTLVIPENKQTKMTEKRIELASDKK
ncbi:LysM peptidoglycan-binding domain-containing protein [Rummeliibacillus sp. TYF005]|uniref:cell division suppressor protein YneA n=1 Tax=unclassified Rummeliibacillus TaxID=2622809 RepID=UPI000E663892|nr:MULTISPECIES: LysM peptidoglycan-binding domain-containing protein [unclassified Rummeliibacillus]RIJ63845.1 LysM peptidoglycan-binding domain-containing protein [Rummeliibacillus sp. POC4]RPJ96738.1 LysM peptidoglycan-binding domain-containing protein [Rummeliibacillus sp. TYF005]